MPCPPGRRRRLPASEVVLEWFAARREMDGLPHNPRAARNATAAAAARGAAAALADALLPPELLPRRAHQAAAAGAAQAAAAAAAAAEAALAASDAAAGAEQQPAQRVQRLTARELATLRSALPSPRKAKGARLAEELGVRAAAPPADGSAPASLEVAGVRFVAADGGAAWRRVWLKRRAVQGAPAQRLDLAQWLAAGPRE